MAKYKENPWNELNPYSEGQEIYGRDLIISKLTDAIYTNLQTVIYGKSGIGKTSLLQAGCFPELRKLHFFPIVIRLGIIEGSSDYIATVIDVISEAAERSIFGIKPTLQIKTVGNRTFTKNRLCQFLYSTQFLDDKDSPYIPVLIFDQFEEFLNNKRLFTKAVGFVKDLYVLLDNTIPVPAGYLDYSNYRLVFAIREDYLYCLEDIIDRYNFDELRYNRYRITALSDNQAQSVIEKTFRNSIEDISSDDLKNIVNIIIPIAKGHNGNEVITDYADIRTPILSLLGSLIYKQLVAGQDIGSLNIKNTNNELYLYYDEIMSEPNIPLQVRSFLEQKLITVDGRRDSMDFESALRTNQISKAQIEYLAKEKKIIRIVEASSGERRIEFSHDTICKALLPVMEMRNNFYNKGNELYFSSFDVEEKQPEMVRYFSYAAELGCLEAQQKLANLYEENVKGVLEDQKFKSINLKRDRLISLLNGKDWSTKGPQTSRRNNNYDVFLSYSYKDRIIALQLSEELQSIGCRVWAADTNIETGQEFVEVISKAIRDASIFLFLASKSSYQSKWVERELAYAYSHEKVIIPLKLDDTEMTMSFVFILGDIQYIDIKNANWRDSLFKSIQYYIGKDTKIDEKTGVATMSMNINDSQINMVFVEGGLFTMGATLQQGGENPDERVVHEVRLDSYYIATVPVTRELWTKVMGATTIASKLGLGKNRPVDNVSWNDCITFINCLNAITGKEFRLPTEAEWEYAAKGGAKGRYNGYKYSGGNNYDSVAWVAENSDGRTHEVAVKQPNELGIYDMSGNVMEWCSDWYALYPDSQVLNPQGPNYGDKKVCRGGCWNDKGNDCRISRREARDPLTTSDYIGFRLVLQL